MYIYNDFLKKPIFLKPVIIQEPLELKKKINYKGAYLYVEDFSGSDGTEIKKPEGL